MSGDGSSTLWSGRKGSSWKAPWGRNLKLNVGALVTPTLRLVRPLSDVPAGNIWVADHLGLELPVAIKFGTDAHHLPLPQQHPYPTPREQRLTEISKDGVN